MADTAYVLRIKAIDEATATLEKTIGSLKKLGTEVNKAGRAQADGNTQDRKRYDQLNKSVETLGKQSKKELQAITDQFTKLGAGVGGVLGSLNDAWKLGSIAAGIGLLFEASKGMQTLATNMREFSTNARQAGMNAPDFSAHINQLKLYGETYEEANVNLQAFQQTQRDAGVPGKNNAALQFIHRHSKEFGANWQNMTPDQFQQAYMKARFNPTESERGNPKQLNEIGAAFGLSSNYENRGVAGGEARWRQTGAASDNMTKMNQATQDSFTRLDDAENALITATDNLGTAFEKTVGKDIADLMAGPMTDFSNRVNTWGKEWEDYYTSLSPNGKLGLGMGSALGATLAAGLGLWGTKFLISWTTGTRETNRLLTAILERGGMGGGGGGPGGPGAGKSKIGGVGMLRGLWGLETLIEGALAVANADADDLDQTSKKNQDKRKALDDWLDGLTGGWGRKIFGTPDAPSPAGAPGGNGSQAGQQIPIAPAGKWGQGGQQIPISPGNIPTPGAGGAGSVVPGPGSANDPRGMIPVIRAAAIANGIDPDVAVRVAASEGLGNFSGDKGTSFGAMQVHVGGGSVGDQFRAATHLDPSDPKNEAATINFAMAAAKKSGWGPWHGARGAGITDRQGLDGPSPVQTASAVGTTSGDDLASHMAKLVSGKSFHSACAIMANQALRGMGLTPLPSDIATNDKNAKGYSPVGATEGVRNDIGIAMNNLKPGELGGHVMVLDGPLQMHDGKMQYPTISTNSVVNGHLSSVGGIRWRSPDELSLERDQGAAAEKMRAGALDHRLAIDISHDRGVHTAISGSGNGSTTVRRVRTFGSDVG